MVLLALPRLQKLSALLSAVVVSLSLVSSAEAALKVTETSTSITLANDRLVATIAKTGGAITGLTLDNRNLLGTRSGSTGIGPYLDCYCIPSGFYTVGSSNPTFEVVQGTDPDGIPYGGVILSDTYKPTGQFFQQFWFLHGEETGLHTFSRVAYYNETTPFLRNLQELRTLFRPNTNLWTHLSVTGDQWGPLPSREAQSKQIVVQDATWTLHQTPEDRYVQEVSNYFTKYTFSNDWRNTIAHGMFADGSTSNGTSYGAWLVMNTKDTYFGGPLHSDLTVDGIVYNYLVSNHHGEGTPNITHGFDRTFGPAFHYFNSEPSTSDSLSHLRADAESYGSPTWNQKFYDSIAPHVPNYIPSTQRGSFSGSVTLPNNAKRPIAVLSKTGIPFQDNAIDTKAYQYWTEIDTSTGEISIPQIIKPGKYRLTIYADGVFGEYIKDDITINPGKLTLLKPSRSPVPFVEDSLSAGKSTELWRIGTPDKSSGEFLHGNAPDPHHPRHFPEYMIYWGAYDFPKDFPTGVNYTVGVSDPALDLNYVHWSVYGGTYTRKDLTAGNPQTGSINNWTINFHLPSTPQKKTKARLTILLAGAKTASGNTDLYKPTEPWSNLPLTAAINPASPSLSARQKREVKFVIPYDKSSSCAVRSAVSCYQVGKKLDFSADWLVWGGWNRVVLSLPYNATNLETAILPVSVYVQYDALRLEVV